MHVKQGPESQTRQHTLNKRYGFRVNTVGGLVSGAVLGPGAARPPILCSPGVGHLLQLRRRGSCVSPRLTLSLKNLHHYSTSG